MRATSRKATSEGVGSSPASRDLSWRIEPATTIEEAKAEYVEFLPVVRHYGRVSGVLARQAQGEAQGAPLAGLHGTCPSAQTTNRSIRVRISSHSRFESSLAS